MPCTCGNHTRISASRLFIRLKSSEVPPGGWNAGNFYGRAAEWLLNDWVNVHRMAVLRGIRVMLPWLQQYHAEKFKVFLKYVADRTKAVEIGGVKASLHIGSNEDLWAEAMDEAFRDTDTHITVSVMPMVQSVASETFSKTTVLLGDKQSEKDSQKIMARAKGIAKKVTHMNVTTKAKLAADIRQGLADGLTVPEMVAKLKDRWPTLTESRIRTCARTEMGLAADAGTKQALKSSKTVTHASVVGCMAIEPNCPTWHGIPTCNIENVPVADLDELEFHPNHTGCIVPSKFVGDEDESDKPEEGVPDQTPGDVVPAEPPVSDEIPPNPEPAPSPEPSPIAGPEPPAEPVEEPPPAPEPPPEFPPDLSALTHVKPLGGSIGAQLVEDEWGRKWVQKTGGEQLVEETAADAIYRESGIAVPDSKLYENGHQYTRLSRYLEDAKPLDKYLKSVPIPQRAKVMAELRKGFALDALMGNRDVIGMDMDNVMVTKDGTPYRVDNGSAFRFRAQGDLKKDWDENPMELWTLRGAGDYPGAAANAAKIFGRMGDPAGLDIYRIAGQIEKLDEKAIRRLLPESVRDVTMARLANMQRIAAKALDYEADAWRPEYADGVTYGMAEVRQKGILDGISKRLKISGSVGKLVDEHDVPFDGLRGAVGKAFWEWIGELHPEAKSLIDSWGTAQGGSSWSDEAQALKHWIYTMRAPAKTGEYWREGVGGAHDHYKRILKNRGVDETVFAWVFTAYYGFVQEVLEGIELPNSDRERRCLRLFRTEGKDVIQRIYKLKPGEKDVVMARGINESGSIVKETRPIGDQLTVQAVPYTRVTGFYFNKGSYGGDFFCGDYENEVTFVPSDLRMNYPETKAMGFYDGDGGNDARKWGVPLDAVAKASRFSE